MTPAVSPSTPSASEAQQDTRTAVCSRVEPHRSPTSFFIKPTSCRGPCYPFFLIHSLQFIFTPTWIFSSFLPAGTAATWWLNNIYCSGVSSQMQLTSLRLFKTLSVPAGSLFNEALHTKRLVDLIVSQHVSRPVPPEYELFTFQVLTFDPMRWERSVKCWICRIDAFRGCSEFLSQLSLISSQTLYLKPSKFWSNGFFLIFLHFFPDEPKFYMFL